MNEDYLAELLRREISSVENNIDWVKERIESDQATLAQNKQLLSDYKLKHEVFKAALKERENAALQN